jgi:hypothetical protein
LPIEALNEYIQGAELRGLSLADALNLTTLMALRNRDRSRRMGGANVGTAARLRGPRRDQPNLRVVGFIERTAPENLDMLVVERVGLAESSPDPHAGLLSAARPAWRDPLGALPGQGRAPAGRAAWPVRVI